MLPIFDTYCFQKLKSEVTINSKVDDINSISSGGNLKAVHHIDANQ